MSEREFQAEIFARLSTLEQGQAALLARLDERCSVRGSDIGDHERRLIALEASAQRRKGARDATLTAAGIIGALSGALVQVAAWLFKGGGQ